MATTNNELLDDVIFAARSGDLDDLKNANANADYFVTKNDMGNTALHMASANGHHEVVSWMIEQLAQSKGDQLKAAVNIQNEEGNTPLHWGALNGHLAVVETLVKNGADCKIKNKMGKTPIYEAQQRTHEKVAEFFLATMIEEEPDEPVDEDEQYVENGYQKQ